MEAVACYPEFQVWEYVSWQPRGLRSFPESWAKMGNAAGADVQDSELRLGFKS